MQRSVLLELPALGEVTSLDFGRMAGGERDHLVVTGLTGFALVDPMEDRIERVIAFSGAMSAPSDGAVPDAGALDVDGDGQLEIVRRARSWTGQTSVHGADGRGRWAHPPIGSDPLASPAPNFTMAGDVDGDGRLEFLMGFNATAEVHLLEDDGTVALRQDWSLFITDAQAADVNSDGVRDIAYVDGEALVARNSKGEELGRLVPPERGYVNSLHAFEGFGTPPKDGLVVGQYVSKVLHEAQEYALVELAPLRLGARVEWADIEPYVDAIAAPLGGASGITWAKLDQFKEQAQFVGFSATWLRLRLFDSAHKLVYEEVLAPPKGATTHTDGSLLFQPATADRPARLLVSNGHVVLAYALAAK